jgi:hypothetical protein
MNVSKPIEYGIKPIKYITRIEVCLDVFVDNVDVDVLNL